MYRTVAQLDNLTAALAGWFPGYFTRFRLPNDSIQGRPVYALRMRAGGGEDERRGVLLVGGTHARELMNPDAIVELAVDLLVSHYNGSDIVYEKRTWAANDIRVLVESLDLWMLPCLNPDGREYVMTTDDMWRKNRRNNPRSDCDGVDLNRNLDILWGVTNGASCNPCADIFCGRSAFSEPETKNVKHLLDTYRIDCFADVHSYSELILHPWGHAVTQTTDTTQRFTGLPSGTCAPIGVRGYQEYMPPRDLLRFETVGDRIVQAIHDVRGRSYTRQAGIDLYATTGTHSDYVYSRHIADPSLRKTYGYTFETGPWQGSVPESFHPADPEPIKRDAKSGMISLAQQCVCAIELIGSRFLGGEKEVSALRRVRDELLGTTKAGREWITLFERVQTPLIPALLADEEMSSEAARLIEAAGRMLEDDEAVLPDEEVERGLSLVRRLAKKSESREVRADVEAVAGRLTELRGRTTRDAVQALMERGPKRRKPFED
jgi:murein tripeptide amidase MpaA